LLFIWAYVEIVDIFSAARMCPVRLKAVRILAVFSPRSVAVLAAVGGASVTACSGRAWRPSDRACEILSDLHERGRVE
jgi:hypothetical protein